MAPRKPIGYYGQFTPTGVDESAARRYRALAGLADQVGDIAFEIGAKKAKSKGEKQGLKEGIEEGKLAAMGGGTQIEEKKGLLSAFSIFDQARNETFQRAYVSTIESDARENIERIAAENPDDVQAFNRIVQEYTTGVTMGISDDYLPLVGGTLDALVENQRTSIFKNQVAKDLKEAESALTIGADNHLQSALTFADNGDLEQAYSFREKAARDIRARNELTEAQKEEQINRNRVVVDNQLFRTQIKNVARTDGVLAAALGIQILSEKEIPGYELSDKEALVTVLQQDLGEYISLQNIVERQQEDALKIAQENNFISLVTAINNGEADATTATLAANNGGISATQYTQSLNILQNRGQGVDDYGLIMQIQELTLTDPDKAQELIMANMNTRLTGNTAQQLQSTLLSSRDKESVLNTDEAKRFRRYLENSVAPSGPMAALDLEQSQRLADLRLAYDTMLLDGVDPAIAAKDLKPVNKLLTGEFQMLQDEYNIMRPEDVSFALEQIESLSQELDANGQPLMDASVYNEEYKKLKELESAYRNETAFNQALEKALKGL